MLTELRKEIKARTVRLFAYDKEKVLLDEAELKLKRLFAQTHETINGRRVKLTKKRKIAKAKAMLESIFGEEIDIADDVVNQLKITDD